MAVCCVSSGDNSERRKRRRLALTLKDPKLGPMHLMAPKDARRDCATS
jgi:hypothetical protein